MGELIFAAEQGRNIPKEDKIFGISNRAKKRIAQDGKDKVVNAINRQRFLTMTVS